MRKNKFCSFLTSSEPLTNGPELILMMCRRATIFGYWRSANFVIMNESGDRSPSKFSMNDERLTRRTHRNPIRFHQIEI